MNRDKLFEKINKNKSELIQLRRKFHQIPELGFSEKKTSAAIAAYLKELGISPQTGVGKTGVVGLLPGANPGATILYRADMDGLPIEEKNQVPYHSRHAGMMHACGHDGHIAMALLAAKILSEMKEQFSGTIKFVFQPAEETVDGAKQMIAAGVLENPAPEVAIGMHVWNRLPVGTVVAQSGPLMAASNRLDVKISGKLSHGAMPESGADSIVAASHFIQQIQTIVSRRLDPREKAVVSIGQIHGGQARNTIGGVVELAGTIRTFSQEIAGLIQTEILKIISGIERSFDVKIEISNVETSPAVVNDPRVTELVRRSAANVVGKENLVDYEPQMGSEDVSEFLNRVPGCFFFVGSQNDETGKIAPHHNPYFDIDEESLAIGVKIVVDFILSYLQKKQTP
ncbi:MAG: amidohydrolase [Calditrichaeota bacterium]|nr:amidohydrolase [Calditrichota bacterium]